LHENLGNVIRRCQLRVAFQKTNQCHAALANGPAIIVSCCALGDDRVSRDRRFEIRGSVFVPSALSRFEFRVTRCGVRGR
jgi:hypothetical protein